MNERQTEDTSRPDEIGALIRLAGERRAVPPERFERVRAAAREEWRREVALRNRRRAVWTGVGLAAAASLVFLVALRVLTFDGGPAGSAPSVAPRVERVVGSVVPPLEPGDALDGETEIATGPAGGLALRLASGHGLRIAGETRLLAGGDRIELLRGKIYVASKTVDDRGPGLTVATPHGIVEETGTQFEVRVGDGTLRVRLREGEVRVHRDAETHDLAPGDVLEVDAGGNVRRGSVALYGEPWLWSESLTRVPDVEGRPALELLRWAARERGLHLVFDGDEPARRAAEALISGNVDEMTVDEALSAVLPTCGLEHEIAAGALTVRAIAAPAS